MRWPLPRCLKFYAVGAIGIAVQLGLLALFTRGFGLHYLAATALAVEASVLHNFLWHRKWTWADRPGTGAAATAMRLIRFNLANGLVSVAGNLFFMHLFAGLLGLDPMMANLFSLVPCALVNFLLSDRWVFVSGEPISPCRNSRGGIGEALE